MRMRPVQTHDTARLDRAQVYWIEWRTERISSDERPVPFTVTPIQTSPQAKWKVEPSQSRSRKAGRSSR